MMTAMSKVEVSWLPARLTRQIDDAVLAAREVFAGERLVAVLLVGAAATPSRQDRARGALLVVIVEDLPLVDIGRLAQAARGPMRHGVRIRTLTRGELERSCDVYALEVADWRDRHVRLAGDDPFGGCAIEDADLRRGLEAALRGMNRRARNRLLHAMGAEDRKTERSAAVAELLERLLTVAHHALSLTGAEPPTEEKALLEALGEAADASPDPAAKALFELRQRGALADPIDALAELSPFVTALARWVDGLEVEG